MKQQQQQWHVFQFFSAHQKKVLILLFDFYPPHQGHIVFGRTVSPFVSLFVRNNLNISHIIRLVRVKAFIFHISIPCDKTFLLVPSSRSSVKVKYQGNSIRKNGCCGGISVSKTHIVYLCKTR